MSNKYAEHSKASVRNRELMIRKENSIGVRNNEHYLLTSRSLAAEAAYAEQKRPYDGWETRNFRSVLRQVMREEGYHYDERQYMDGRMSEIGKFALRKKLLRFAHERHHVGIYHELVAFYEVDRRKLLDLIRTELPQSNRS